MADGVARDVLSRLLARGETVAVAESLTGGMVCAALTEIPGSSAVFRGGMVTYTSDLKAGLLGVDTRLLAGGGPVQMEVAAQLAAGVRERMGADWGIATTGVAGPGPADGHPAGTVFVGVDGERQRATRLDLEDGSSRPEVRAASVDGVLRLLAEVLIELQES